MKKGVPLTDEQFWTVLYLFPRFRIGLEIGCGDGYRVWIARRQGINLFGVDEKDYSEEWKKKGLEFICRQSKFPKLFYRSESFDYIICFNPLLQLDRVGMNNLLTNIYNRGNENYFLKFKPDNQINQGWILSKIDSIGYKIKTYQKLSSGNIAIEARK